MAYSDTIKLVVGDTLPELTFTLKDSNTAAAGQTLDAENDATWAPIDLSSGTVRFRIREVGQTTVLQTITASITDATGGECALTFPTGTWTAAGTYEGELEFTKSNGQIQTVQDLVKFKVRDDFD
jgi:hypothetical protein